jgi:hypothetical protein
LESFLELVVAVGGVALKKGNFVDSMSSIGQDGSYGKVPLVDVLITFGWTWPLCSVVD